MNAEKAALVAHLENIAESLPPLEALQSEISSKVQKEKIEFKRFPWEVSLGAAKLTLQLPLHSEGCLYRIKTLKRSISTCDGMLRGVWGLRANHTLRRAKYSKQVAQEFLADEEPENWAAYQELYGMTTSCT